LLQNIHTVSLRPGLIILYDLSKEKGTRDLVLGMLGARAGSLTAAARELAKYK
jgi:hypothetical protein